jgi:hypothetical protein
MVERALDGERVHDGGEHADVIGGGAVHAAGGCAGTAPEIPAAHDDAEFQPGLDGLADFQGDAIDDLRRDVVARVAVAQSLAAEFENGALEGAGVFGA